MSLFLIHLFVFFTFKSIKSTELIRYNYGSANSLCNESWISEEKIQLIKDGVVASKDLKSDECFSEGGWTCGKKMILHSGIYEPAANEFTSCDWDQSSCDCNGYLHVMDECIYSSDLGHYFMLEGCEFGLGFEEILGIVVGSVAGGIILFICFVVASVACSFLCVVIVFPLIIVGTTAGIFVVANSDKDVDSKGELLKNDDIEKDGPAMVDFPTDNNKDVPSMVDFPTDNDKDVPAMVAFPNDKILPNQIKNVEMVQMPINYHNNEGEEVSQKKMQEKDEEDKELTSSDEDDEEREYSQKKMQEKDNEKDLTSSDGELDY